VEQKHVFGIMAGLESFLFGASSYLTRANVPVTGTGIDGPEWGSPSVGNMFDALGSSTDKLAFTTMGTFFKSQGCTSVATETYASIPGAVEQDQDTGRSAVNAGLKNPLNDISASLTSTDLTPQALNIKDAHADCVGTNLAPPDVLALATALAQNNVTIKALLTPVGYGSVTASSSSAAQGVDFIPYGVVPAQLDTAGMTKMMAAVNKYTSYKSTTPDIAVICGWLGADLMIEGLELAGKNPTRVGFENALHNLTSYTAGGVLAGPVNLKQSLQGTYQGEPSAGDCIYVAKYVGTTYKVVNGGKPVCGTLVK
jgi:branched-chain amino acid transport system substrate-binding protein